MKYQFKMPLYMILAKNKVKGKKYHLNLNNWHNWHFGVRSNLKKEYQDLLKEQMEGIKIPGKVRLEFTLHRKDNRRVDRSNILCLHEKFFCDALVLSGCIEDDNDEYIVSTLYQTGCKDKEDPRVEVSVIEID